jgi:hypothetical protein
MATISADTPSQLDSPSASGARRQRGARTVGAAAALAAFASFALATHPEAEGGGVSGCAQTRRPGRPAYAGPYLAVRRLASSLDPAHVAYLDFDAVPEHVRVSDRRSVAGFISALRKAELDLRYPMNRASRLTIHFRRMRHHRREPVVLNFCANYPAGSFGPEFWRLLRTLGSQQAVEVARWVRRAQAGIVELEGPGIGTLRGRRLRRALEAMTRLTDDEFACNDPVAEPELDFRLRGGGSRRILFLLAPPWDRRHGPALPFPFDRCYQAAAARGKSIEDLRKLYLELE